MSSKVIFEQNIKIADVLLSDRERPIVGTSKKGCVFVKKNSPILTGTVDLLKHQIQSSTMDI